MKRYVFILFLLFIPHTSYGQQTPSELYAELDSLYYEIIRAQLEGGKLCTGRSSEVVEIQNEFSKALLDATSSTGELVLIFAVTANSLSNVIRLNEDGALHTGDNGSILHAAAKFADPPILEYLVSVGFGIEEHGGASGPALLVAVSQNRKENVAWLIENGADVNATDTSGGTVLQHSLVCRDQELVNYLLMQGAIPDEKTYQAFEKLDLSLEAYE